MPWNEDGSRKDPALYKKSGFKMKGWSAFTKPDEYEPQTKTRKSISTDITPQTRYPKVGETFIVKDSAERTEIGKIMDDDNWGRLDGSDKNYEKKYMNMYDYLYSLLPENCIWF